MVLVFDSGDTLPAHSLLLKQWSSVLAGAVHAGSSGEDEGRSDGPLRIPLPGTSKTEWLQVAQFMYPVLVPIPEVSWSNLHVGGALVLSAPPFKSLLYAHIHTSSCFLSTHFLLRAYIYIYIHLQPRASVSISDLHTRPSGWPACCQDTKL